MSILSDIKIKTVKYCAYQDRCQYEVEQKLYSYQCLSKEEIGEVMVYLIQNNFLNEERFTRSYVRGKFYQKQWGKIKITSRLKLKNIPQKLIDTSLSEIDENDYTQTFNSLANKKWALLVDKNIFTKKKKLFTYLAQKGYENNLIYNFIEDI